jgi:hypothetical protein
MLFTGGSSHTPENRKGDLVSEKDPVEKKKKIKAEGAPAKEPKKAKKTTAEKPKTVKSAGSAKAAKESGAKLDPQLTVAFINKLNDFILLNIELFTNPEEQKQKQYFDFIQQNIHIMTPLFFSAGEDFMKEVFKRTDASKDVQDAFIERWNTLRRLSDRIYEFVRLQVNMLVRKDPDKDQKAWKTFIMENINLMNEEFFRLGKKVFIHLLDQAVTDQAIRATFLDAWDQTAKTVQNLKDIPQKN